MNIIIMVQNALGIQGEEINSRAGVGGVEEEADSDQAPWESNCLSWFLLTLSGSFGQVSEKSPGGV